MPESNTNSVTTLRKAIENLERLINEHSTDFSKMSELVSIIKEHYLELNTSQQQLIESNAALVQTVVDLGGPTGSCCASS
jgi:hypothetical protein